MFGIGVSILRFSFMVGDVVRFRMKVKEFLLLFMGPAVLCSVALAHRYMVSAHNLNPWERGGFAMFATAPKDAVRILRTVFTLASGGELEVGAPPPEYKEHLNRLLHMPSRRETVRFAQSLIADQMWVEFREPGDPGQGGRVKIYKGPKRTGSSVKVKAVELTVYEYQYDGQSNQLTGRPIQNSGLIKAR